ncbi:hypothetical protein AAFN88_12700 [Pelagibius sp. CAU 1746]|uniref:hypothetical protein n=1 Tax=Pelagibius sp. CAU 1746 TaxID=3140370 RepID=UPI00325AE6CF
MTDDASVEAAGEAAGGPPVPARAEPAFTIRNVPLPTAEDRRARRAAMDRAIEFGAAPYRDAEGRARYVVFKDANNAPVEAWTRDREAKRGYRRTQYARKAAGQMAWHPEDQIELAKRLGVIHHREGRSVEGAAERGLYDAIWRYEHVWDSFTVPRRIGGGSAVQIIDTGRIAAVAEEEARKLQAEDPRAIGGFWVRDRKNNGLIYVVPNPDPEAAVEDTLSGGQGADSLAGDADIDIALEQFYPADEFDIPTESYDPSGFYQLEETEDGSGVFVLTSKGFGEGGMQVAAERRRAGRYEIAQTTLDDVFDGIVAVLDSGRDANDPAWQQLARIAAEVAPGTGNVLSAREAYIAFKAAATAMEKGDWGEALLNGGEALFNAAGAVPAFGELLRLGKGAVKVANLLYQVGRTTGARPVVAAMARSADELAPLVKRSKQNRGPFKALEKTPGGNEAARLVDLRQKVRRRHSGGFFEQSAEGAFEATRFPPRNAITNERRGLAATGMAVTEALHGGKGVVRDAMFRLGAGSITFYFGEAGNAAKRYRGGSGLAHIIAKHGPEVMPEVIETITKGTHRVLRSGPNERMVIEYNGTRVVLALFDKVEGKRKSWLLTGFEKGDTDINFDLSQLMGPLFFKSN